MYIYICMYTLQYLYVNINVNLVEKMICLSSYLGPWRPNWSTDYTTVRPAVEDLGEI